MPTPASFFVQASRTVQGANMKTFLEDVDAKKEKLENIDPHNFSAISSAYLFPSKKSLDTLTCFWELC